MTDSNINKQHTFSDKTKSRIHMLIEQFNNDPKGFRQLYGEDGVDMLVEASRRLAIQSSLNSSLEEQEASSAFANEMQENIETTSNPSQTLDKQYNQSAITRFGKGGHKGLIMGWNSMVDLSRGLFDPENHAKWVDFIGNRFRKKENHNKAERWMEKLKGEAVRGRKGFVGSWMRSIAEPWEYRKYGNYTEAEIEDLTAPWMKGTVPYADENLGVAGKMGEILGTEVIFMGPLTIARLARARKAVKYFNDRSKKSISNTEGKWVKDEGWVSAKEVAKKEGKEAGYEDYIAILKTLDDKTAKKYKKLYEMGTKQGTVIKKGGGAMLEVEAMTSAVVVGAGTYGNTLMGEKGQLVGEIGGGIMGPALLAKTGRYGLDWMNYLYTKVPGTPDQKMNRALRSLKMTQKEIDELDEPTKKKLYQMIASMPLPSGFSILDLSSRERKNLLALRWFDKEFQNLPQDLREDMLQNLADIDKLTSKFDPNKKGLFFATMDRALQMGALKTMREKLRADYKLGKMVTVRMDEMDMRLAKREAAMASELASLLKEYKFANIKDTGFHYLHDVLVGEVNRRINDVNLKVIPEAKRWLKQAEDAKLQYINPAFYRAQTQAVNIRNFKINPDTGKLERFGEASKLKTIKEGGQTKVVADLDEYGNPKVMTSRPRLDINSKEMKDAKGNTIMEAIPESMMEQDEILTDAAIFDELPDIESLHKIPENGYSATAGGRALKSIQKILSDHNAMWINVAESGEDAAYSLLVRPNKHTIEGFNPSLYGYESRQLFNKAFGKDKTRADKLYDNVLKNEKINNLEASQANAIATDMGNASLDVMSRMPDETQEAIKLKLKSSVVDKWLMQKRKKALITYKNNFMNNAPTGISKPQRFAEFEQSIDDMFTAEIYNPKDYTLNEKIEMLTELTDIQLDAKVAPMDIKVSELKQLRTDIMESVRKGRFGNQDERLASLYDSEVVHSISNFLENVEGLEGANSFWKSNVFHSWHQGYGKKIMSKLPSGEFRYADEKLFDFFINADDTPYEAAEMFKRLATRVNPEDGTIMLDPHMVDHLQSALIKRLKKSKPNETWFSAFSEFVGLRNIDSADEGVKNIGMDSMDEAVLGEKGKHKWKTVAEERDSINKKLMQVDESINPDLQAQADARIEAAWKAHETDWGMSPQDMNRLLGTTDEAMFRTALLDETYRGGNPEKALSVYQYIREIPDVAKRKKATESLQAMLWHGAIEAAEDSRVSSGMQFQRSADDVVQIRQGMEMNSLALQMYTDRNRQVLQQILGPKEYKDLQEMTSLAVLVTGEIDAQAIKNLPTEMQLKSIMSRIYGVVRQVVSPRYVLTELLIQDARFRKGKLLQELASDPDSAKLLTQVVLKNGLTSPKIRTEFVSKFWGRTVGPMLREKEDIREEETWGAKAVSPRNLMEISEEAYNEAFN
tara:strand:- start:41 stop:4318 length:4278 start_codon:yes stop_codon:yes gene_type:complete